MRVGLWIWYWQQGHCPRQLAPELEVAVAATLPVGRVAVPRPLACAMLLAAPPVVSALPPSLVLLVVVVELPVASTVAVEAPPVAVSIAEYFGAAHKRTLLTFCLSFSCCSDSRFRIAAILSPDADGVFDATRIGCTGTGFGCGTTAFFDGVAFFSSSSFFSAFVRALPMVMGITEPKPPFFAFPTSLLPFELIDVVSSFFLSLADCAW